MQEEIITNRFSLNKDTTLQAATAAVMSVVFPALKAEGHQESESTFSGIGQKGADERTDFPAINIHVSGILKDLGEGNFAVQITLKTGKALGLGKLMAPSLMNAVNIIMLPILFGGPAFILFRGSFLALLVGAGLGLLFAILSASSSSKMPTRCMINARKAVESKLSGIEFTSLP